MERRLIVNADDFGLSAGVNRGIIDAHRDGIVTSTSLMVRWPDAAAAAALAHSNPALSIGLHVDLGEWYYDAHNTDAGNWPARYDVVDLKDADAVRDEVIAQVGRFTQLMGREPSHLDSHQHVHHDPLVRRLLVGIGDRLGVPVRAVTKGITYCGDFYGQDGRGYPVPEAITVDALVRIIESLPDGTTELACHAGYGDGLVTTYADERADEVRALCDPRVRAAVDACDVVLSSFGPFRRMQGEDGPSA